MSGESCLQTISLAKELLTTAFQSMDPVMLIIDGFDEYKRDKKSVVTTWFKSIIETTAEETPGKLRGLFVSQDDGDIRRLLPNTAEIRIRIGDTKEDIGAYINNKAPQRRL